MNLTRLAWFQLISLTLAHFMVDLLSGMVAGFLPVLSERYTLSIGMGVALLTVISMTGNIGQLWCGTLRRFATQPLLVPLGVGLTGIVCLIGFIPAISGAFGILCLMMVVLGLGLAMVHPEGLRGICAIRGISLSVTTSFFMLSGFLGFAMGPWIGANIVSRLGMPGLLLLLPLLILTILAIRYSRVRLAVERQRPPVAAVTTSRAGLTFWELFMVAVLVNTGCSILQGLLPTYLKSLGFSLDFGGLSAMLFGIGASVGSILVGFLVKRLDTMRCLLTGMLFGIPVLITYIFSVDYADMIVLVPLAGFLLGATFPQIVVLSRNAAKGPAIGLRMGLIVGGTWGIAGILFLGVGQLADWLGLKAAMNATWICYLAALVLMGAMMLRRRQAVKIISVRE